MTQVDTVAVLGAGDMGHGIAELASLNGFTVRLRDVETSRVEDALDKIEWSLDKLADKGQIPEKAASGARERITGTTELAEAVDGADLVLEAVPEDLSLKQKVFAEVEDLAPDGAVLATNTSTMRPTEIGAKLDDASRLVGMHFFNPVLLMDLVEIVPAEATTEATIETAEQVSQALDKTYVTLERDTPGFVTSRLVGAFVRSSIRAWQNDLATREQIDAAMTFEAGFPMGPFELADYTGLDIGLHASEYISERLGEAYAPTDAQRRLVDEGKLGKKTGEGFYAWDGDEAQIDLSPEDAEAFDPAHVLALVANEAARLLDEDVASPEDIDLAMRNGAAFPTGPLRWADEQGLDEVLDTLAEIQQLTGDPLAAPADALAERVDAGDLGVSTGQGFFAHDHGTDAASLETVQVNVEGPVGTVTLDRPHRMNAINPQLVEDLEAAVERLDEHDDVRVIVITGAGDRAFSVGADLQGMDDTKAGDTASRVRRGHELCDTIAKLETPTVAAVDGYAFGGGLELTLPCDLRVASEQSRFQLPEVTLGLLPAMGATFRLPKLVGTSAAKEIAMLGERVTAERAREMGLVHRVWPTPDFEDELEAFTAKLASNAPLALRHVKGLLEAGHDASPHEAREAEANAFELLAQTDDAEEGITAMFQDREPEFSGK